MEKYINDSENESSKVFQILELCNCPDEKLLKEFEAASQLDDSVIPKGPDGEADIIWNRILKERLGAERKKGTGKVVGKRFGWKKVAAVGLTASVLAGGGCIVAMGTKSYFYREVNIGRGQVKVLVNDSYKADVNSEDDAYVRIGSEVGIKPLKMSYVPEGMKFNSLEINDGYAFMVFDYQGATVGFTQTKFDGAVSYDHKSEFKNDMVIFNKWLNKKFIVKQEALKNGMTRYETSIVIDGGYYGLYATIEEEEFIKIVERLSF
ncbi:DUF4367 domain-containing protein [Clostridium porci]|uniref:DUF4367 domain-containing protein n=1 Tax=Clostridium porci TaxID=2605778 RepID=UPI003A936C39